MILSSHRATDPSGRTHIVRALCDAHGPRWRQPILHGGRVVAGGQSDREFREWPAKRAALKPTELRTEADELLERLEQGRYRIVGTDTVLTSTDPAAP